MPPQQQTCTHNQWTRDGFDRLVTFIADDTTKSIEAHGFGPCDREAVIAATIMSICDQATPVGNA